MILYLSIWALRAMVIHLPVRGEPERESAEEQVQTTFCNVEKRGVPGVSAPRQDMNAGQSTSCKAQ